MVKKLSLSFIFAGLLVGVVPAVQTTPLDTLATKIDAATDRLKGKFGPSRSVPREMVEQLLLAFYFGGETADGSFDAIKGAAAARDGLFKVASDVVLNKAMFKFLSSHITGLTKQIYKDYCRIWSRLGFDFVLRGIKYANGTAQDKSFSMYLKNEYLPNAAKKLVVYWSLFGLKIGTANLLNRSPKLGPSIMEFYTASKLIPFVGIIIEDAAENVLEHIYDKSLDTAKLLSSIIKKKLAKNPEVAVV